MKELFMTILNLLYENETVTEALLYEGDKFARIQYVTPNGKYSLSISKDEENGNL